MRLFPPPLEVGPNDGFALDMFGRENIGEGLANLLASISTPLVVALDGEWGTGKSTFLKMWSGDLRNAGFPVVQFDAFEHDYIDDAFMALSGEVVGLVQEKKQGSSPKAKRFLQKAVGASKVVARSGVKVGVKALTLAAIDAEDFHDLAKALSDETSQLADKAVAEVLSGHRKGKDELRAFRDALSELAPLLAEPPAGLPEGHARPLIMVIDELDRCRPAFALELLERAKHFFSVPNVHFVLGVNLKQLENSVHMAYGAGVDARTYLQKFIQLTVTLDKLEQHEHDRVTKKYINYLRNALDFPEELGRDLKGALDLIQHIADVRGMSLRTIERIMTMMSLGYAFTSAGQFRLAPLVGGLAVLKVLEPSLYAKARSGRLTYPEASNALMLGANSDAVNVEWLSGWWRYVTEPDLEPEALEKFGSAMFNFNFGSRLDLLPYLCDAVMDRFLPR